MVTEKAETSPVKAFKDIITNSVMRGMSLYYLASINHPVRTAAAMAAVNCIGISLLSSPSPLALGLGAVFGAASGALPKFLAGTLDISGSDENMNWLRGMASGKIKYTELRSSLIAECNALKAKLTENAQRLE